MPKISFQINRRTQDELSKRAADAVIDSIVSRLRDDFTLTKEFVKGAINGAIEDIKDTFIPTDAEIYELGVGVDGRIDREKTDNAWKGLLTNSGTGAITVTFRKGRGITGVGNIYVEIDFEQLYQYELSRLTVTSAGANWELEWMRWFIEGKEVSGSSFYSTSTSKASRTGGGIMIKKGLWEFRPHYEALHQLNATIKNTVERVITRLIQEGIN